jgi:hypothetical protein
MMGKADQIVAFGISGTSFIVRFVGFEMAPEGTG